jgi:beta-barrel assembly-enhancing protease
MRQISLILLIAAIVFQTAIAIELPQMGLSADTVMSTIDEQELGQAFMRHARRTKNIIDDIEINHYFQDLGYRLASYSDNPEQHFHFFVINDPSINAFAVPGGFIGIYSGLILKTRSESELASVIAHEIAHVTQRHIARIVEAADRLSVPTMAAMIAAVILAGATGSPQAGQAILTSVLAGNVQMQINFTRTHEQEADRLGMQILAKSGFDPRDMPRFFERMQEGARFYSAIPEFLRTHPVTINRIAEARDRAEKYPVKQELDKPLYHLMRAKLLFLIADNKQQFAKILQNMLKTGRYRDERAIRYALALALLETRQTQKVQKHIDWLFQNDGDRVIYHLLKARLVLLQNSWAKAESVYEQALDVYPSDKILGLDYAEKLLQNNRPGKAKAVLLGLSADSNPEYYDRLARVYQLTGEKAEAQMALAEKHYLMGYTQLAIEQLEMALKMESLDFYLASRIEARYKALQAEWLEEQKALK